MMGVLSERYDPVAATEDDKDKKPASPLGQRYEAIPDLSNAIAAAGSSTMPLENAPTFSEAPISAEKLGFKTYDRPYQALGDIFTKRFWQDVGRIGTTAGATLAPYSTDDPKQRQEILVKNVPGAKATTDKWGNPMIEFEGKKYYMSKPGIDAPDVIRTGLGVSGGALAGATLPVTLPGLVIGGGLTAGGISAAEDVVARAAGGESRPWVDPEKAGWATLFGGLIPLSIVKTPALAGELNRLVRSGTPLTDEALAKVGLTAEQIQSLTPELRQKLSDAARRTFGDPKVVGATYRTGLSDEFAPGGGLLTRGEISRDPTQLAREQTLSQPSSVAGRAEASAIIQGNRTAQDVRLNQAQEVMRAKAGGGKALLPGEAGDILKSGRDAAYGAADATENALYGAAKDPAQVVAGGGTPTAPLPQVAQVGDAVRAKLATTGPGRAALDDPTLTPNAIRALEAIDRWRQKTLGPRAGALTDISWESFENQRKILLRYREAAFGPGGTKTDQAAVQQVIDAFTDHFTPSNPLLAPARAAASEKMSTFVAGGSAEQDKATKAVLKALDSPEPGVAVTNSIFGSNLKTGENMLDHLNQKVFVNPTSDPAVQQSVDAARQALSEQSLRRLFVDADGKQLSPQQVVTKIDKAFGDQEGSLYRRILSGEQLAELRRIHELYKTIASARTQINPPNSGLIMQAVMGARTAANTGTAVGAGLGYLLGAPLGHGEAGLAAGGWAGRRVGAAIDAILPSRQAAQAIRPPPSYMMQGAPSRVPGILGQPAAQAAAPVAAAAVPGLLDDFWQRQGMAPPR